MTLKDLVIDKVNELGPEKAAEFFGKKATTVKTWLKNAAIPLDAVQRVLDAQSPESRSEDAAEPEFEPATPQETATASQVLGTPASQEVAQLQDQINHLYSMVNGIMVAMGQNAPQVSTGAGYGFRPSPLVNVAIPPDVKLETSHINTVVPPKSVNPAPVVPGNEPYLPQGNSWCRPHATPPVSRV